MNATQKLHGIGQSLWLDNITRELLTSGTLRRYRDEFAVTGLTSNPTIFDHALGVQLQREGAEAFDKSWDDLLECITSKSEALNRREPSRTTSKASSR
jgi:hypothetical protein